MKILLFILIFSQIISAQWKRISAESEYLFDVTKIGSFLFAGGENAIYVSDGKDVNKWNVVNSDIKGVQDFVKYEDLILAVANSGIYESNNGGFTWEKRNNGTLSPSCLLPLENIWLAGITSNGVYRSIDYGKNWIYNSNYSYDSLSIVTSLLKVDRKIFAVSGKGLQVSNDNSLSWQKIDTTISSQWHTNNTLQNIKPKIVIGRYFLMTAIRKNIG